MAQASDQQMQTYSDQRIRQRAEQARALIAAMRDDKAAIDSVYDRAANGSAWSDSRTDGPPKLLTSQDVLTFNAFISLFLDVIDGAGGVSNGTAGEQKIYQIHANLAPFQAACVRPMQG